VKWYQLDTIQVLEKLESTEEGLTHDEARQRLEKYGPNKLAEEEKISSFKILLHQFASPLIYILLIASLVTFLLGEYIDCAVIVAVVVLNAIIGFTQEFKAEESVRALKKLVVAKARVVRGGREKEISSTDLVPGDIVLLASGTRVPADLRLLHTIELKIDEAMLTGESFPTEKTAATIARDKLISADQLNMAFMGSAVVNGRAKGVVVATGATTVLGSIAGNIKEVGEVKAPIQEKIEKFAKGIGFLVLAASSLLFFTGLLVGESMKEMFMTAVAAAVATIPEGLPIVVTIALAVGVARMARNNAIIRKLPAVETLGSTTVICSDKTGTLTRNEMTVRLVHDGNSVLEVMGTGYEPKGEILHNGVHISPENTRDLLKVMRIGLLCNESNVYEEDGLYKVDGDPTEGALIVAAMKAGLDPEKEKEDYELLAMIPFESERGYMATLHRYGEKKFVFVKGAPEKLIDMCAVDGENRDRKKQFLLTAEEFANEGLRVLAFAWKEMSGTAEDIRHPDVESGLIFAGLQGMIDPPRPDAIEAVGGCKKAGIRVVMITGDHAVTATAIARQLGFDEGGEVLTGRDLEAMDDEELFARVKETSVFARVSPEHKLRITEQLLRHREIVAMTGDGVNDAPALKASHIGVAMGITGTDVAKEASDMVLADDNFASIFSAVREGRIVFDNLRKVIFFLIPTGIASILSIIGTMAMGLPIPYVPAQLLWINLVTNGLQDVALAFEPGEKGIADRPPHNPKEGIMSRLLIERTILVGFVISAGVVYNFVTALGEGDSLERARTVAVTTMVFFQFFQAWNSRSELQSIFCISPLSNPFLFYSMIAAFFAQLAMLYVPALQWIFRTVPLSATEWVRIVAVSFTVVIAVEFDKWLRRRVAGENR
jgi:Ca2+-transporting ATPase